MSICSSAKTKVLSEYTGRSTGFSVWGSHGRDPVHFGRYEVRYLRTSHLASENTNVNETQSWQGRVLMEMPEKKKNSVLHAGWTILLSLSIRFCSASNNSLI
ncbi:unnamed protein product [Rangifer tarandus platyrhynchus]|uniref:Uncharacterized protein n=1 Tax=Rangifer tarandus platyrhynchus TaxID=3082113 RepID=A0AC59Y5W2_RANTA